MKEYQEFQDKCKNDIKKQMKFSKDILELRHKQDKLIKLQKFEEAESIAGKYKQHNLLAKADKLEQKEQIELEKKARKYMTKKENKLKEKQEKALGALLNRIKRDKNEQLRQRQEDSQKLIKRNRNLVTNLLYKQNIESKTVIDQVEQTLRMTKMDKIFTPDMSRFNTALPAKRKKIK